MAGTKFVVLHSIGQQGLDELMRRIYEICKFLPALHAALCCSWSMKRRDSGGDMWRCGRVRARLITDSDAVMKNPFHTPEMPINSTLFESRLHTLIVGTNGP